MISYLVHYGTLLQNATDIITKFGSYYKMRQKFITKCINSITKCDS